MAVKGLISTEKPASEPSTLTSASVSAPSTPPAASRHMNRMGTSSR